MSLLLVVLVVWAGLLVAGLLTGSAIGLAARRTDAANDRDLHNALARRQDEMARARATAIERARRTAEVTLPQAGRPRPARGGH